MFEYAFSHRMKTQSSESIAAQWFRASEATGDFMGIRYGHMPSASGEGSEEVEWSFVSHCMCDGIGGFARLLREHGAELNTLPSTRNPCRSTLGPLWKLWRKKELDQECADRRDWVVEDHAEPSLPPPLAWHLFTREETKAIQQKCGEEKVSVNSFLLKHLDQAVRPDIQKPQAAITWMVPVNLRGDITHNDDCANHVSYIEPRIAADDSPSDIQNQIRQRLLRGEHRAVYFLLGLGRFLSHKTKVKLIIKGRNNPAGNIGAFSNLGVWDSEKTINTNNSWFFCPPVVKGQLLGAGCVTFQNRLSLTIQGHPALQDQPEIAKAWMKRILASISLE